MPYLLDTNVWIDYLKNQDSAVIRKLQKLAVSEIVCCSIVRSELMHGARKYGDQMKRARLVQKTLSPFLSYSFCDKDADVYAKIRDQLETAGTVIGPYDLQIASIALRRGLTLVTRNTREFSRVEGLKIEDWSQTSGN